MNRGFKTINFLLGLTAIVLGTWLVKIWSLPVEIPTLKDAKIEVPPEVVRERAIPLLSYYNIITEKDLFRPSRKRYVAKVKPPPPPPPPPLPLPAPPPPPKRPIPKFTLYGTVILEENEGNDVAIISTNMQNRKPDSYNLGDNVEEGFVLKEIHKNKVVVERDEDGETVEVSFKAPSVSPVRPGTRLPGRSRPEQRRRGNRKRGSGPPVFPPPEPISHPIPTPPSKSGKVPSSPRPQDEPESSSNVLKSLISIPYSSQTTPETTSQHSGDSEDDNANSDGDTPSSPPSEESGETPQEEGGSDIPSPSPEDANEDEMPPPIPPEG